MNRQRGDYYITDDRSAVDLDVVEALLRGSYWAADRPRAAIETSLANSTCFSVLHQGQQVGFARVVTDHAAFAWIADVMIAEAHRGWGLGKWLVQCVLEHPCVANTSLQLLRTRDAHGLYERFGFERVESMSRRNRLDIENTG